MPEEERQVYGLRMPEEQQAKSGEAEHNAPMHNLTIRDLKKSVDAHDRPGVYSTVQPTWKDAGCELLQNVTNVRLAEYLIGMSTLIPMPQDYWPDDDVKWSVNVMEHRASKRHQGGHAFQVLLAESTPAYTADGSEGTFAVELSAKKCEHELKENMARAKRWSKCLTPNTCSRHQH